MKVYSINEDGTPGEILEVPDGTSILPANQTWAAPPVPPEGMVCLFDRRARQWLIAVAGSALEEPAQDHGTIITRAAFRSRFTQSEKIAIELAGLDDPSATMEARSQAAAIRTYQKDVDAAEFIDLTDPATAGGVQALEAAGLLAAGRAAEILTAPVQWSELPSNLQGAPA